MYTMYFMLNNFLERTMWNSHGSIVPRTGVQILLYPVVVSS